MLKNYFTRKQKRNSFHRKINLCFFLMVLFSATKVTAQTPELVSPDAFFPKYLTEYDGKLFFNAQDADGKEWLWSTDGTTTLKLSGSVTDSHPGSQPQNLTVLNNQLIFSAVLQEGGDWNRELFKFDGTEPVLIKNIQPFGESAPAFGDIAPVDFGKFNGKLYFTADDGNVGSELWATDGTEAGTNLVANIALRLDHSYPEMFIEYNNKLLFTAQDYYLGRELYITDGTPNGTGLVKEILSGAGGSQIKELTAFNNKIYFSAYNDDKEHELWVTDGTNIGTHMVKNIGSIKYGSRPADLTVYNEKLYFSAEDETHGREIWVSDGTEEGTKLFKDLGGDKYNSNPTNFTEVNGKLYFGASNGTQGRSNYGLWVTDGTVAGTVEVKNLGHPPKQTLVYENKLYFELLHAGSGGKLWVSDGTKEGTKIITAANATNNTPIYVGQYSNRRSHYKVANGTLYFTANFDDSGIKLYKVNTAALSVEIPTKNELTLYPNPVNDVLHIDAKVNNILKTDLFSITGQALKSWGAKSDINLSQFAAGIYVVKITTGDDRTFIKRVVKN